MFQQGDITIFYIAGTLFIVLLVLFILFFVYIHHLKVQRLQSDMAQQELRIEQEQLIALQKGEEKERVRLAEELHDGIGARLSGLHMNLEYLHERLQGVDDKTFLEKQLKEMDDAINEIREITKNLKPAFISSFNLKKLIELHIDKLKQARAIKTHIEVAIDNEPEVALKLDIYRILTELLNNIYKHSGASDVFIQVIEEQQKIQIIVEDNGKGFEATHPTFGNGLTNIKNRVSQHRGIFNIDSSQKGTTVIIEIPYL